jgi:hypothetical protein
MQIKMTMRFHLTLISLAIIKETNQLGYHQGNKQQMLARIWEERNLPYKLLVAM